MVHPYNSTDTVKAWKNCNFILLERSDFHMVINLLIAIHTLLLCMLTLHSVDEILLPKFMNWSNNFSFEEFLFYFIRERSDFHMVINLSIAVHTLLLSMLTLLSVDEILLPKFMNWSNNFSFEEFLFFFFIRDQISIWSLTC